MNLRMSHEHSHCCEEEEEAHLEGTQAALHIFDAESPGEDVPHGFNAVRVCLDATITSSLDWSIAQKAAQHYSDEGYKIFWELDFGLFDRLMHPMEHPGQFHSFVLSLEHFRDTLWEPFRNHFAGLCFYRGPADFTVDPLAASDYLGQLAQILPDSITKYVMLDTTHIDDPLYRAQLLSKDLFFHFHLGVKGSNGCGGDLGWEQEPMSLGYLGSVARVGTAEEPVIGICLPTQEHARIRSIFEHLDSLGERYRVIPESQLTVAWHGLDSIFVVEESLSPQGKRMLNGFRAAGGEVVSL